MWGFAFSLLIMLVNEESLRFRLLVGQIKQSEDVTLDNTFNRENNQLQPKKKKKNMFQTTEIVCPDTDEQNILVTPLFGLVRGRFDIFTSFNAVETNSFAAHQLLEKCVKLYFIFLQMVISEKTDSTLMSFFNMKLQPVN